MCTRFRTDFIPPRLRLLGLVEALEGLQAEMARPDWTITFTHENVL